MNILVVEDDKAIRDLIDINLQITGYKVLVAEDGEVAKNIFLSQPIDLVLLDVMLPKIDGFELVKIITKKNIPVIFITAKESVADRVKGLKLGADDYIVKPFESIELLARVEVVLRRYKKEEDIIKLKDLEIDVNRRIVKKSEKIIELTLKEFDLLVVFLKNKNIALSREQLLNKVWGFNYFGGTRTVDIHVQRIREKLDLKDYIKTIFKVGYRLDI